jgi:bifunctional oligoribonuclease and PAP phosphatase NrnA
MNLSECAAYLRAHDNYLLLTHRRPDGDTLGSASALCHALRRLGKTAHLYKNPGITETYIPFVEKYYAPDDFVPEQCISVDVAEAKMLAEGFEGEISLKLDHHVARGEQPENAIIWTHRSSCGELILALIDEMFASPDKEEADLLYIAVSTDTGCFCYANTNADTFRAAARLFDAGADLPYLNKIFFRTKTPARLALEGMVCSSLRSYRDHAINIAVITLDMLQRAGVTEDDCSDLAALAGQVKGSRVSVTIREQSVDPPRSKVSLRTDGDVDASQVCARFGGGGHKMASGCEVNLPPLETADAMLQAVEDAWVD